MKRKMKKQSWLIMAALGVVVGITVSMNQNIISYGKEPIHSSVQNTFSFQDGNWIYYIDLGTIMRLNIKENKTEVVMQPEYTVNGSGDQIEANLQYLGKAGDKIIFQTGTSEIKTWNGKKAKRLKGTTVNHVNKQLSVSTDSKRFVWLEKPVFNGEHINTLVQLPVGGGITQRKNLETEDVELIGDSDMVCYFMEKADGENSLWKLDLYRAWVPEKELMIEKFPAVSACLAEGTLYYVSDNIYKIDLSDPNLKAVQVYDDNPNIIKYCDGRLYCGNKERGIIYRIDLSGSGYQVLYSGYDGIAMDVGRDYVAVGNPSAETFRIIRISE